MEGAYLQVALSRLPSNPPPVQLSSLFFLPLSSIKQSLSTQGKGRVVADLASLHPRLWTPSRSLVARPPEAVQLAEAVQLDIHSSHPAQFSIRERQQDGCAVATDFEELFDLGWGETCKGEEGPSLRWHTQTHPGALQCEGRESL